MRAAFMVWAAGSGAC